MMYTLLKNAIRTYASTYGDTVKESYKYSNVALRIYTKILRFTHNYVERGEYQQQQQQQQHVKQQQMQMLPRTELEERQDDRNFSPWNHR